jgi:hypothetical protein
MPQTGGVLSASIGRLRMGRIVPIVVIYEVPFDFMLMRAESILASNPLVLRFSTSSNAVARLTLSFLSLEQEVRCNFRQEVCANNLS